LPGFRKKAGEERGPLSANRRLPDRNISAQNITRHKFHDETRKTGKNTPASGVNVFNPFNSRARYG
jgi:hypothetical protein